MSEVTYVWVGDLKAPPEDKGTGPEELQARCLRCGRALSNPVSMRQGYGPICIVKIATQRRAEQAEQEDEDALRQRQPA